MGYDLDDVAPLTLVVVVGYDLAVVVVVRLQVVVVVVVVQECLIVVVVDVLIVQLWGEGGRGEVFQ